MSIVVSSTVLWQSLDPAHRRRSIFEAPPALEDESSEQTEALVVPVLGGVEGLAPKPQCTRLIAPLAPHFPLW